MSYILDALRKAEHERRSGLVPTLDTVHLLPPPRQRRWPSAAGALLVVGAVGGLVGLWLAPPRGMPGPVAPAAPTPAPSAARPPEAVSEPARDRTPEASRPGAPMSAPARRTEKARTSSRAPTPPAATPAPPPASAPARSGAETHAAPPAPPEPSAEASGPPPAVDPKGGGATATAPRPVPPDAERPPAPPQDAPGAPRGPEAVAVAPPTPPEATSVPSRPASPAAAVAPPGVVPKLSLDALVFSDNPAERMVFINGRKYVEGQAVDGQYLVEGITREGAVLSAQGQRFILRPRLNPYLAPRR